MRHIRVLLPLLLLACDGVGPSLGRIQVVAQPLTASAQITRVTVTVTPASVTQDLTVDPQDPSKFTGTITVPVGTQTVQADAFAGDAKVGSGTASVTVGKNAHMLALITILDNTGPVASPDHSPVVTSLVTPAVAQVDDQSNLSATSMDADGNSMSFSWTASPTGCGTFASPTLPSTAFIAKLIGTCTVTFTVTANGKSDSRSASIQISAATGFIDVRVTYVPQPLISSIAFLNGSTPVAAVSRLTNNDGTIRAPFHKGTPYTVVLNFDPWSTGAIALSDSCPGTIVQPAFAPNAISATATWTPTVDNGACIVTAILTRQTLTDTFFVVVLPVP
ncbi:MAG TPA: hypothetical protein VEP66_14880 [Myxococcales bacterium]|nr:hypothetical protein [Myxococcales bacterium]